jgi:hypothetical protein
LPVPCRLSVQDEESPLAGKRPHSPLTPKAIAEARNGTVPTANYRSGWNLEEGCRLGIRESLEVVKSKGNLLIRRERGNGVIKEFEFLRVDGIPLGIVLADSGRTMVLDTG